MRELALAISGYLLPPTGYTLFRDPAKSIVLPFLEGVSEYPTQRSHCNKPLEYE